MKIRTENVEISNIRSKSEMLNLFVDIKRDCDELARLGCVFGRIVQKAEPRFNSANYQRLTEALHRYDKKTAEAQAEIKELWAFLVART